MSGSYRQIKEDVQSHNKTGTPCGTPCRYKSPAVVKMGPAFDRRHDNSHIPIENIETEGDRQLQVLLKRQLDTEVTLHDQLAKKRVFTEPVVYSINDARVAGQRTLNEFRSTELEISRLDELRQCGLTDDEIQLKLTVESREALQKSTGYGADPAALASKLKVIEEKIDAHKKLLDKPVHFAGAKTMTRHEMDLELAITHDKEKMKLLGSLLKEGYISDPSYGDMEHPINHLDSILEEALAKRRKNNPACALERTSGHTNKHVESNEIELPGNDEVLQPMPEATCQPKPKVTKTTEKFIYVPEAKEVIQINEKKEMPKSHDGDTQREIRQIQGHIEVIPEEAICKYRLPVQEIRKLEHFANYEPGKPNKTLYLKNLSSKATELDLVSLFHRYQRPETPIQYRLMSGRMKGQAFITLDSTDTATEALELINGYHFKGKPIIIQYGRS